MQDLPAIAPLIVAAFVGLVVGASIVVALARRWTAAARESGHAARDSEVAVLTEQRDAAAARTAESGARIERYERDWSAAEQNVRAIGAHAAAQQAQAERLGHELADVRRNRDEFHAKLVDLTSRFAALEAGSREQAVAAADKLKLLDQAEVRLRESFQNLANRILEDKSERLREQSATQLGGLLDPLKIQLKEFREAVTHTHASDQRERGMLTQEIQGLKQLNQRISEDAINLTRALKGDTRSQGAWGEMVLERVLEASGLQAGREYETQLSFGDGHGGRQRPDVIVHLPDDKDIVVDAKVSLVAYERFVSCEDDGSRALALAEHLVSLRRHIDGLSARGYENIEAIRTLDFVLLFIPVEAAFIEAVRADENLYGYALAKNISLVSPSTLLATLRTVAHLWRIERRNVNAVEIARRAALLHDNFVLLVDELGNIGQQLEKAQRAHGSAVRRLTEGGKGSILLQVQSLAEMGAPVKKSLQLSLLESASVDEAAESPATEESASTAFELQAPTSDGAAKSPDLAGAATVVDPKQPPANSIDEAKTRG